MPSVQSGVDLPRLDFAILDYSSPCGWHGDSVLGDKSPLAHVRSNRGSRDRDEPSVGEPTLDTDCVVWKHLRVPVPTSRHAAPRCRQRW
jgi:hypothetical protein